MKKFRHGATENTEMFTSAADFDAVQIENFEFELREIHLGRLGLRVLRASVLNRFLLASLASWR